MSTSTHEIHYTYARSRKKKQPVLVRAFFSLRTLSPFTRAKKIGTARQIFGIVPRLPVPRLPPGGSPGTPKILSTGTNYIWDRPGGANTFTRQKLGVPCLKIVNTEPKIWRAVPIFLARVNEVFVNRLEQTFLQTNLFVACRHRARSNSATID